MATRLQVKQLSVVTDIREMRLQRLLTEAIVALEMAESELGLARERLTRCTHDKADAETDFAKAPSDEIVRIWRDVCVARFVEAETAMENAQFECDDAQTRLVKARVDVIKIKERGTKVVDLGSELRRSELRLIEARLEDDVPARCGNSPIMEGIR